MPETARIARTLALMLEADTRIARKSLSFLSWTRSSNP
jgi:hypothetical protein